MPAMSASVGARTLLAVSLLLGAALGGWTAGLFRSTRVSAAQLLRCLVGGVLMGWGSLLLPGGNEAMKRALLVAEGVVVRNARIRLQEYRWSAKAKARRAKRS